MAVYRLQVMRKGTIIVDGVDSLELRDEIQEKGKGYEGFTDQNI